MQFVIRDIFFYLQSFAYLILFESNVFEQGLNKLASNDSNKVRIVRMNALPLYTELLVIGNPKEQGRAAKGLWRLAFRCKDFIIQEPGCIEGQ